MTSAFELISAGIGLGRQLVHQCDVYDSALFGIGPAG